MLVHFDYDGVLVNSLHKLLGAARKVAETTGLGRAPTEEDFATIESLNARDLAVLLGIPSTQLSQYASQMHAVLSADPESPAMFPGMAEVLRQVAQTHRVVIVTSNLRHVVQRGLAENGLEDCVSLILDALQHHSKRDQILWALGRFNVEPGDSCMVGDSTGDIRHGREAGVTTIAVTWGFQPKERLLREDPDFVVESPRELARVLAHISRSWR